MFDYRSAFSRNIGWVTEQEQEILRHKRVAIAGLGGVGGSHLLTLTRLGIGKFNIADFDHFEIHNFNRQAGASLSQIGRPKLDVMAEMALDINSELELGRFSDGVTPENLSDFLDGIDLYVDSLDFFAFEARRMVFAACAERGIPAITAAPLGMGAAFLCFMPGCMTFEEYFQLEGQPEEEQALRLMLGLSPALLQLGYLVDDSRVDFEARKGPSTPMACEMCAGVAGTQALKILLNRGKVPAAPRGVHYDAYKNKLRHTWRPWGNRNPVQLLGLMIARKHTSAKQQPVQTIETEVHRDTPIHRVLELARWAPSGDNEQPWRFSVVDDTTVIIRTHDTRDWCVYDLDGRASQLAVGALLETLSIAASGEGMQAQITRDPGGPEDALTFTMTLSTDANVKPAPWLPYIETRVTHRRPYSSRPLTEYQKARMEEAAGADFHVIWLDTAAEKRQMAKLLFNNAHIRLTTPEAYEVHRKNIEWGVKYSEDRLPEYAVGVDYLTGKIMRWALGSWERVKFLNRFAAGTWLPRLQMDLLTGLRCAAHFVIVSSKPMETVEDYLTGGGALQRFWLEAARQNIQLQPAMTPLIFSRYVAEGRVFTREAGEQALAEELAGTLDRVLGPNQGADRRVFMGRVGFASAPKARSLRLPLNALLQRESSTTPPQAS